MSWHCEDYSARGLKPYRINNENFVKVNVTKWSIVHFKLFNVGIELFTLTDSLGLLVLGLSASFTSSLARMGACVALSSVTSLLLCFKLLSMASLSCFIASLM